ncbi:hypothetical protein Bca4012_047652 [Brassica carinata]
MKSERAAKLMIEALLMMFLALARRISMSVQVSYTQLLIDGNFVDSASGDTNVWFWIGSLSKTFPTLDRRTWKVIVNVAEGDTEDINQAVKAARKAIDADLGQR